MRRQLQLDLMQPSQKSSLVAYAYPVGRSPYRSVGKNHERQEALLAKT